MPFLTADILGAPAWFWAGFLALIAAILVFDLLWLSRRVRVLSLTQSTLLTAFYTSLALLFGVVVWLWFGAETGALFFTAFIVEQSLSIDNVFVMSVIFSFFAVPREAQHRVLFWGIIVAMVLRGIFVGFGTAIVAEFEWVLFLFGAFLVVTGFRMLFSHEDEPDLGDNRVIRWMMRRFRVTTDIEGERFFLMRPDAAGIVRRHATPLFLAFMTINIADLIFAVDSVPAVLALTQSPFIVYTSNIFAILGLRALYFVIAALIARFAYLRYALSVLLVFIGGSIFYKAFAGEIPAALTLGVTLAVLGIAVLASWLFQPRKEA